MPQLGGSLVNTSSCYPGGEHPQLVVQQYKVRVRAKVQGALLFLNLQALSRVQSGRLDRIDNGAV